MTTQLTTEFLANQVSYSSGQLYLGGTGEAGGCFTYPNYWDTHYHYYTTYLPSMHISEKSKVEQAFKIVSKLLEKKIIKTLTVKQFIELTNDISEIV